MSLSAFAATTDACVQTCRNDKAHSVIRCNQLLDVCLSFNRRQADYCYTEMENCIETVHTDFDKCLEACKN
jgi:hypothetical protein